jgi:PAS domain S-box-containing protein
MNHGMNSQWMEMSVASFRRLLAWPFVLLAAAIVALTLGGIAHIAHHQQQKELARLQAIATFKTNQIATWLREREGDAQLLQSSRYVADLYRRWRDTGDLASRELLLQRLDDYRKAYNYQEILLLNDRGEPVLATADTLLHIAPELRTTIQRAVAEGRMLNTGLYRGVDEPPTIHLDFVIPLLALEDHPGVVIVLHVDPRVALYPLLASWPIPSASGEILLFRRDGDQVLYLSDLRQHPDAAAKLRLPIAESRLLAARVLRGEVALDGVAGEVAGIDYRGAPALGVAGAIPGTDWFLLAKLDQAEVYAPAWRDAGWIGLLGALALLAAAAAQIVAHQRREQSEKLESLQQLANERHRLRTLIQTIPDLIWLKDPDGAYLGCNPRFERFVGAKEADLIGKSDHDFFDPEQADFFRRKDREALAADRPNANEEWITFAEDSHRELLQTIKTPMRDVSGNLVGVLGIGRDITALREAEAGKQAVERQYQALFRAMQDGCALHELIFGAGGQPIDYRFLAVNPAFERLIGLKAEHLLGKTVLEVLPCVERYWIDLYGQVVLTGEPALFENYSQDLGRYFKVKAFRPEPGQFACIVTDITERKQAEQALRDSEERYRVLAEYSPDWEYWFGTDGGYRYISPACLGITGYTAAEFMADPGLLERLVHPADRPVYAEHFRSLRANVEWDLVELEFRIRCRDGRERWIGHICSAVVDERGRPLGRRGVNRDITERKQAEQALSVALEEKTSLLKEVHHRVKNNLQIVTSLLNLQARQVQNPAALAALQDTQGRIRSMALLHETLYREGDLGKADGAVYLSHLCAHLHSVFSAVTGRVRLRHQLDPVALTPDQAVPCGLIVNELVSNAFKHAFPGERGGEIQVALTAEPDGHRVLAVTDNGVGLPPGLDIEQSDTLGLQLVAGLAHQLGGAVETRTTAGTMFRIAFPAPHSREVLPS